MKNGTKWIWIDGEEQGKNLFVRFKKEMVYSADEIAATVSVTADSRYFLYIGGKFLGTGPPRSWPRYLTFDSYPLTLDAGPGSISLEVLVWHYGTSTSQYIHGRGGVLVEIIIENTSGTKRFIGTDTSWLCAVHQGYERHVPRINVSQPWVESFDAGFDTEWRSVEEIGSIGMEPWKELVSRDIPFLSEVPVFPKRVIQSRIVFPEGKGVHIDYKDVFYPRDTSTEDKLHLGYLCTIIESRKKQEVLFTLNDRKWPLTGELLYVNGVPFTIPSGGESVTVPLCKGENLFLFDVSGAHQRISADFHFFPEDNITFKAPFPCTPAVFAALGPFESFSIGNIVCVDGFSLDYRHPVYVAVSECADPVDLVAFRKWIKPVGSVYVNTAKHRMSRVKVVKENLICTGEGEIISPDGDCINIKVTIQTRGHSEYTLDFGREVSGFLEFEIEAEEKEMLDFLFFEHMEKGKAEIPMDLNTTLSYVTRQGVQRYRTIVRRGFRYVRVTVRNRKTVTIRRMWVNESLYPAPFTGTFECSDEGLNDIWRICRSTVALCMEDTYADAPAFEQAFWIGDAMNTALFNYYLFGAYPLSRRSLHLAAQGVARTEIPSCHLPAGVDLVLTSWALFWIISFRDYLLFSGDSAFLAGSYPAVRKTVISLLAHVSEEGLLAIDAWNMLDWAPMDTPYRGVVTHQNASFVEALKVASVMAQKAGQAKDAEFFIEKAKSIKRAINRMLWNAERRAFIDSIHADGAPSWVISLQTQIMILLWDCVEGERKSILERYMIEPPDDFVPIGSPFMSHFYYRVLAMLGRFDMVIEDIRLRWGEMLDNGATTCWETFKGFYKDRLTRSYCHAWSSSPSYFLPAHVLGVSPISPGFREASVFPAPVHLEWARGAVPTPLGGIGVDWEIKNGLFRLSVNHPEEITCRVAVPVEYEGRSRVIVNGEIRDPVIGGDL